MWFRIWSCCIFTPSRKLFSEKGVSEIYNWRTKSKLNRAEGVATTCYLWSGSHPVLHRPRTLPFMSSRRESCMSVTPGQTLQSYLAMLPTHRVVRDVALVNWQPRWHSSSATLNQGTQKSTTLPWSWDKCPTLTDWIVYCIVFGNKTHDKLSVEVCDLTLFFFKKDKNEKDKRIINTIKSQYKSYLDVFIMVFYYQLY